MSDLFDILDAEKRPRVAALMIAANRRGLSFTARAWANYFDVSPAYPYWLAEDLGLRDTVIEKPFAHQLTVQARRRRVELKLGNAVLFAGTKAGDVVTVERDTKARRITIQFG